MSRVKANRAQRAADGGGTDEDSVRLPSLGGVRPGVYLAGLYAAALLVALFLALLAPGLARPGVLLVVSSSPEGAAVRVDGVYRARTPASFFVERGGHELTFALPGFEEVSLEARVAGRVFASLFAPERQEFHAALSAASPLLPLLLGAQEAADWSFAGEPTAAAQVPPALSRGAYRQGVALAALADEEREKEQAASREILRAAARFASTRFALKDLCRSLALLESGGNGASPFQTLQAVTAAVGYLQSERSSPVWLADLLEGQAQTALLESAWYRDTLEAVFPAQPSASTASEPALDGAVLDVGGLRFYRAVGGRFTQQTAFPQTGVLSPFWVAEREVSERDWLAFVEANPGWQAADASRLAAEGLATSDYLRDFARSLSGADDAKSAVPDAGVSGVSWYAALAYCDWLQSRLPASLAGWKARLPSEREWEYAARAASAGQGPALRGMVESGGGPADLGLWEWCSDPYVPLNYLGAAAEAAAQVSSPRRSVRGGSWVNPAGTVLPETRASLPPETCAPFVGFRPVLAREDGAP